LAHFSVVSASASFAVSPDEMLSDPKLEMRARTIAAQLRCLVCQNQSIDESDASLARDLRLLVREKLNEGLSDAQVLDYIHARYGDFVLLRPPFKLGTLSALGFASARAHWRRRGGLVEFASSPGGAVSWSDLDGRRAPSALSAGARMVGARINPPQRTSPYRRLARCNIGKPIDIAPPSSAAYSKRAERAMAQHSTPHYHNQPGVARILVGAKEFMCIGALPPFDHPDV